MRKLKLKQWQELSKADLELLFLSGNCPSPLDLLGPDCEPAEWTVHMLTGVLPDLATAPIRHRKRFLLWKPGGSWVDGCNMCFKHKTWGFFHIEREEYGLVINYDLAANNCFTRRIRDLVHTTPSPDVMLGKFYLRWRGRMRFVGFFTLTRIAPGGAGG